MKKVLSILLGIVLMLTACSGNESSNSMPSELTVVIESETAKPSESASKSPESSSSESASKSPESSSSESATSEPSGSGSSKSPEASGEKKTIEPQQLISKEDAKQLLGEAVKEGEANTVASLGLKTVLYRAEKSDSKNFIKISIVQKSALSSESQQSPANIFLALNGAFGDPKGTESGIGDEAFISSPGMNILADGYYLSIVAGGEDTAKVKEILKKAGEMAVGKLKKAGGQ